MPISNYEKLRSLLAELFQLDQADLDFGIYRIMNQKRDEIVRFLDKDLLPQVQASFAHYLSDDQEHIKAGLDKAIEQANKLGLDPEQVPMVRELRARYGQGPDLIALENEVFSELYSFFRRYYNNGDFIAQRRYKEGVYAIPYEGEEVKLHWANADQYYVKTSEYFRDYTFKLPSDRRVHFKLAEAATEQNNNKPQNGDRRFILCGENPIQEENGELVIRFEYRMDEQKRSQAVLTEAAVKAVLNASGFDEWHHELASPAPTEKNKSRTLLEKRLSDYTARNTFDYFIHKDLGSFLRRELDFYIKNEIVHLDDIENESVPRVEQYLSKIKVIRQIAHKIIAFLAQIEDFQKKLWLKKKFVIETNYCVTLDRVPEELYEEIAANDAQREEWVRLFAIDEIKADLAGQAAYSKPLTVEFLKHNPHLVLDTKFFDQKFRDRLLASFDDIEKACDGVLIHSENSHALRLLQSGHSARFDCVYIDPPFNTEATQILYKNDYRHSSWLSLIGGRLRDVLPLMNDESIICVAIDDFELSGLMQCLAMVFGEDKRLANVLVRSNPHGRAMAAGFSSNHEYALFYAKTERAVVGRLPRDERRNARYPQSDENGAFTWINFRKTGAGSGRQDRPKLYYPVFVSKDGVVRVPTMKWQEARREWMPEEQCSLGEVVVLPLDSDGSQRVWNMGWERAQREAKTNLTAKLVNGQWQIYRKYHANQEGALPGTWWDAAKYSATESGTRVVKDILGEREIFSYPKSISLVEDSLRACNCTQESCVIDFFAGSGTTGHAVINLNREDEGNRNYILVEMGDYFDNVLKPRIQKVVYSKDWKDGKPVSREGSSHMFKYIRLESYEDALNNLELKRTPGQTSLLDQNPEVREEYMLSYMLDVESRGSVSLLNVRLFEAPFSYKLKAATGSVGETKLVNVDLVETFNYLLGLTVRHVDVIRGFHVVEGRNPAGEKALVIWRNTKEKSNKALDDFFLKQKYNTRDSEFDLIYVNGDNNLENLRREDETWKVRLIEDEFHRLMFDVKDI